MTDEEGPQFFGISLVGSEPLQLLRGPTAAMVEQDGGERPRAMRAKKQRMEPDGTARDDDSLGRGGAWGFGPYKRRRNQKQCQDKRVRLWHSIREVRLHPGP